MNLYYFQMYATRTKIVHNILQPRILGVVMILENMVLERILKGDHVRSGENSLSSHKVLKS